MTAVYVHIPFCETKCPYCDFNSFAIKDRDVDSYLDALAREMDQRGVPTNPGTIFIGGGTPTAVTATQLARYLDEFLARLTPNAEREFTVEANPGSLTADKVAVLRERGVTRLSIGAQSFFEHHLRFLGRVHSVAEIEEAYALARDGGIPAVSLDFIYALPGMTTAEWEETLRRAVALRPDHLSCYALTYEPGTEFFARRAAGRMKPIAERTELAMFRLTERRLRTAGLLRYEISNFAKPDQQCRHNLNYWRNGGYAGFGAGAFSYLQGRRLGNERHLGRYADAIAERGEAFTFGEELAGLDAAKEMVVLGLRMAEGVDLGQVERRCGVNARREFAETILRLEAGGFVRSDGNLRLARRGWRLADEVAAEFL